MNPLKSARVPCRTLSTVSWSTVPRSWTGSKITVAGFPYASLLPWSVSVTPLGNFTVDDADGEVGALALGAEDVVDPALAVPPLLHPATASTAAAVTAASTGARVVSGGTRSLSMPVPACPRGPA